MRLSGEMVYRTEVAGARIETEASLSHERNIFECPQWSSYLENDFWDDFPQESLADKFAAFLDRAGTYRSILSGSTMTSIFQTSQLRGSSSQAASSSQGGGSSMTQKPKRQIVLLEDLPNVLHQGTQDAVHSALRAFIQDEGVRTYLVNPHSRTNHSPRVERVQTPLIVIVSDAGVRGEDLEDTGLGGSVGPRWRSKDISTVDVRTVLPLDLLNGPYVTQVAYVLRQRAL
jgi:cell cycle checkpoint protein